MENSDPNNWNSSLQSSFALRSGILLIAEVGVVSFIAVTILLAITIFRCANKVELSLTPSSSIQAVGNILTARWAFNGKVTEGSYCTAQAVIKQIGDGGVSWFTTAIAVMTFLQTMFPGKLNQSQAHWLAVAMIVFIFVFQFLSITIPATTIPHYYGNTGPWCWIPHTSGEASRLKIGTEYAYFWLAATVSLVLYGTIVVNWLREGTVKRDRRRHREALSMAWYPIAYTVEVLPMSLVRFLQWDPKGPKAQHGFIIPAAILFASSGAINALLWLLTGRRFGFSDPDEGDEEEDPRRESHMMHILSPVPGSMLSSDARGVNSPGVTAGGEPRFSHPRFPEDPLVAHRAYVPEPHVWMPPREGELGP
ncbi:hypothetical protein BS47DRAFT_1453588 [Hydnum rufescens UP504]|uniref:Glucose receptor Git3 N-terminal domain-containing protein n=1 Tax=Hydnum rufescens UP504 TaxID=1448309 RepID=A0A9P6AYC6_9AGAM|nr:hypothetical protein BS47DRAFT_1453588 [Hydnum rufescens UP504]